MSDSQNNNATTKGSNGGSKATKKPSGNVDPVTKRGSQPIAVEDAEPEKEKNCEGKQIGGFIIGKTKGKGTFGKVK